MTTDRIILEEKKRFSKSILWSLQREFYTNKGIEAWAGEVPYYITSNPFIADAYANIVIAFMCDWLSKAGPITEPFYLLELGTGPGQFSFYMLKRLSELKHNLDLEEISFRYVMSDFTPENLKFWQEHPALQQYIQDDILDFAIYDMEKKNPIHLVNANIDLTSENLKAPLVVFANYIFDTLANDIFTVKDGKLLESLITLITNKYNVENGEIKNFKKLTIKYAEHDIDDSYYDVETYNQILKNLSEELVDTHFQFPVGSLNAIEYLRNLANGKLLLLSSDKGYTRLDEIDHLEYPHLDFHGSFSVMVNFIAIARYFSLCNGDFLLQTTREGISSAVFASGFKFNHFKQTSQEINQHIEGFSPADYFVLHESMVEFYKHTKPEAMAAHLCLSRWDPYIFEGFAKRICNHPEKIAYETQEYLAANLGKIADNFYYIPECHDVLFDIAVFYHGLDQFDKALKYYQLSQSYFGDNYAISYNLGISCYHLDNYQEALRYFQRALKFDPHDPLAKEWIGTVKQEISKFFAS